MERRQHEFELVQTKAYTALANDTPPYSDLQKWVIQIAVSPAFDKLVSWFVFSDHAEQAFVVRKTTWDRLFDSNRFRNPMDGLKYGWHLTPRIDSQIATLETAPIQKLLKDARNTQIEDAVKSGITLDGVSWRVFVDGAFGNQSRTWNAEPKEWRKMIDWCKKVVNHLDHQQG